MLVVGVLKGSLRRVGLVTLGLIWSEGGGERERMYSCLSGR